MCCITMFRNGSHEAVQVAVLVGIRKPFLYLYHRQNSNYFVERNKKDAKKSAIKGYACT